MKLFFPFILFVFLCMGISAQGSQNVSVSGTVYDPVEKMPVEQASIRFLNVKDSTYVNGTVTNANGKFDFRLKSGNYIVHVSFIGYIDAFINVDATKARNDLGTIELKEDGVLLREAVVTAKAVEIIVRGDTVEYNADSYKVQESAVVEDLLKKMPGVEISEEGRVTVDGKSIGKILLDGKEFFGSDPKVALKNLPAAMVDKLQVLDRKSDMAQMTGFDDDNEETVINLTIKKGMKQGLSGNATVGAGNNERYGISGLANYMLNESQFTVIGGANNTNNEGFTDNAGNRMRGSGGGMSFGGRNGITESLNGGLNFAVNPSENLKWGGNVNYGNNDNDVERNSYTQYYTAETDPKGNQYQTAKNWGNSKSENISGRFRIEWTPDEMTKIIANPNMAYGNNRTYRRGESITTYENPNDTLNFGNSDVFRDGNSQNAALDLEVSRRLGKTGRVLSFRISGGFDESDVDGYNNSATYMYSVAGQDSASIVKDQIFEEKENSHNWRGYVSFVEPVGNNNLIQVYYDYRKNSSESNERYYSNDGFDNYNIVDTTTTKKTDRDFVNQEIGVNFKSTRERYNYTVGVSLQPSNSETWVYTPHLAPTVVSTKVVNFAPVAQFNYMWTQRHNLRLNYNGRTNQPTASQLALTDNSDPMNIITGNPNLKPGFTNTLRARYQKFNPTQASTFMLMGNINFSSNDIVRKVNNIAGGARETTYDNVNGNWSTNLRVMTNRPLTNKKFSINMMTAGSYSQSSEFVSNRNTTASKNTASSISLSESLGLQYRSDLMDFTLRGNYNYSNTENSLKSLTGRTINRYGGSFATTIYFPHNFTFVSDINYSTTSGSTEGFGQKEWLWNASIAKQLFKAKNGTVQFKMYDILRQRSNVSQSASGTQYRETVTNTLNSYFMVSFQYKFQIYKGGAKQSDMENFEENNNFRGSGEYGRRGPRF